MKAAYDSVVGWSGSGVPVDVPVRVEPAAEREGLIGL
jgi:hypothetical protein